MLRPRSLIVMLVLAAAPVAHASDIITPFLRDEVSVASEIVRIGDLIEHAGALTDVAVFRSPDLGQTGMVQTARVIEAVRRHGLTDIDTRGLSEVAVTRLSRGISVKEIEERVALALAGQRGLGEAQNLAVTFDREVRALQLELAGGDLRAVRATFDPYSSRFDVSFEVQGKAGKRQRLRYTGTLVETVRVATLSRAIGRGDVIRAGDIAIERRPKAAVAGGAVEKLEDIAGLAARRPLAPGQPIRAVDLMKPEMVRQNETVTVLYEAPGLMLSVRGKALESGAEGDLVNVLNVHSKRTMQGTVTGPGRVSLAVTTPQIIADPATTSSIAAHTPPQRVE